MATFYSLGKKVWFLLWVLVLPLIVALILADFVIGRQEKYRRNHVHDYGFMVKQNDQMGRGGFLKENMTAYVTNGLGGKVRWTNNAAGFRNDQEFSAEPPPGTLRILSMGDSFTAGYRVGQHQTFSYLLQQWLNEHLGKSQVMVSEIEEPITALYFLQKYGLSYHPQIVLMGITLGNDIGQAYNSQGKYVLITDHAGNFRIEHNQTKFVAQNYSIPAAYLQKQSYLQKKIHAFQRWFWKLWLIREFHKNSEGIVSYFDVDPPRIIDYCNGLGMYMKPLPPPLEEAYQRLFQIILACQTICQQHHIIFAVELFPQRFQVQPQDWQSAVEKYSLKKSAFDLMGPNKKIRQFCEAHEITLIDPTLEMAKWYAKTGARMYLPFGDMHWNKTGHRAFFECALSAFEKLAREGFQEVQAASPKGGSRDKTPAGVSGYKPQGLNADKSRASGS